MNANEAISTVRQVLSWIGLALVIVALLKFAGVQIPVRAEFWQIAILGLALK